MPTWEQKPVAILAIDLAYPKPLGSEALPYEPWTVSAHWEQALVEKVQGVVGRVVQCSPSLILVAFGLPPRLEQFERRGIDVHRILSGQLES